MMMMMMHIWLQSIPRSINGKDKGRPDLCIKLPGMALSMLVERVRQADRRNVEDLQAQLAQSKAEVAALQGEVQELKVQLEAAE
jgi:TolA-binding protein